MRFERTGGPPDMQTAFQHLIVQRLKGRALDDNKNAEAAAGRFPDFGCFRDIVLIEMKHLETDQHERINEVLDAKVDPDEKPIFYATRDANLVMDKLSNRDEISDSIANKLLRTIESVLSSANKQFTGYRSRNPRKNSVNICVILNSSVREFTPDVVIHAIHRKMKQSGTSEPRFPAIDAVLYFSEKHYTPVPDGRIGFAVVICACAGALRDPWKMLFVDRIVEAWSQLRTSSSAVAGEDPSAFDVVHDIPDRMTRSDAWFLEYQRNPYLKNVPDERLKVMFNRNIAVSTVAFFKGDWPKPSKEKIAQNMREFAHLIEETNRRGIDLREFARNKLSPQQLAEIHQGLPDDLVRILTEKDT